MSNRIVPESIFRCALCGHEGPISEFEKYEDIMIRALGQPLIKRLYRCRDHQTCELSTGSRTGAAHPRRRPAGEER